MSKLVVGHVHQGDEQETFERENLGASWIAEGVTALDGDERSVLTRCSSDTVFGVGVHERRVGFGARELLAQCRVIRK